MSEFVLIFTNSFNILLLVASLVSLAVAGSSSPRTVLAASSTSEVVAVSASAGLAKLAPTIFAPQSIVTTYYIYI